MFSGVLTNCEAWYSLTKTETRDLEYIDKFYLRSILQAPLCTGIEGLHLETGTVSLKYYIVQRRIMFLHYILNEDEQSLLYFLWLKTEIQHKMTGLSQSEVI